MASAEQELNSADEERHVDRRVPTVVTHLARTVCCACVTVLQTVECADNAYAYMTDKQQLEGDYIGGSN